MATNVATLTAKLEADIRDLKKGLGQARKDIDKFERQTTDATAKTSKGFGGIGKAAAAIGVAAAGTAVLSFAKSSIDAFSSLEESVNAVNVVFGDAAEEIHALGVESADTFGLSTRAVNQAAVSMGAFADKIDAADPAGAFENIIQRATDFGSVMDITTEETLEKFRAALSGEAEPLKRFGINVSEANVKLFALETGLIKTGETMDEAQKIQARYGFVMQETAKTAGDFANTSDGLAGSQKKLTAKWEEAQAELGKRLEPVMTQLLQTATDLLPAFGLLVDVVGALIDEVTPGVEQLAQMANLLSDLIGTSEAAADGTDTAAVSMGDIADAAVSAIDPLGDLRDFMVETGLMMIGASESAVEFTGSMDAVLTAAGVIITPLGDVGDALDDVGDEGDDAAKALTNVWTAARKLSSPVFAAKEAQEDLAEALREVEADGKLTADELDRIALANELVVEANAEVNQSGIDGYQASVTRALGLISDDVELVVGEFDKLDTFAATKVGEAIDTINSEVFEKTVQVDIRATVPTSAEMDRAVIAAVNRARRNNPGFFNPGVE